MLRQFSFLFTFLFLSSCTGLFPSTPEPEVKNLLISLSDSYLTALAKQDIKKFSTLVFWEEFLGDGSNQISKEEFSLQFQAVKKKWPNPSDIPFLGLKVTKVTAVENNARVVLQKIKQKDTSNPYPEEYWIKFVWGGSSWLVSEDSLFGRNKFLATIIESKI